MKKWNALVLIGLLSLSGCNVASIALYEGAVIVPESPAAPVYSISSLSDTWLPVDQVLQKDFVFSGATGDQSSEFTVTSSNQGIIQNSSINITYQGEGTYRLSGTPESGVRGVTTITVTHSSGERKSFELAFNGVNLEVPIEMGAGLRVNNSNSSATHIARTQTTIDSRNYDGNPVFYFEVTATNASSSAAVVELLDENSNVLKALSIPAGLSNPVLLQGTPFTAVSGEETYTYRLRASGGTAGHVMVTSARILVVQTNATKTELVIPLRSHFWYKNSWTLAESHPFNWLSTYGQSGLMVSGGGLSWISLMYNWFEKNTAILDALVDDDPWTFEVTTERTNPLSTEGFVGLFNVAGDVLIPESEIAVETSAGVSHSSVRFRNDATNFSEGDLFTYKIKSDGSNSVDVTAARLKVRLHRLQKGASYHLVSTAHTLETDQTQIYDLQHRIQYHASRYSNPVLYFENVGESLGGVGSNSLVSCATNSCTSGTLITNSTLSLNTSGLEHSNSGSITIPNGSYVMMRSNRSSTGKNVTQGGYLRVEFENLLP